MEKGKLMERKPAQENPAPISGKQGDTHKMEKQLIIRGTTGEVERILCRLAKDNPNMTIKEYLDKYSKDVMVLE